MATLGTNNPTLLDWAKVKDPSGGIAKVVEILSQTNDIVEDMSFMEGNLETGHRVTVQTALPTVAYKLINGGTTPSKGRHAQFDEQCAIMEAWSNVDEDIAELNGDVSAYRATIAMGFLEAMSQKFALTILYGNAGTDPEQFTGLSPRYAALGQNVISGSGSGSDNTSIWLIGWGPNKVYGIFPKGSNAGLVHEDKGKVTITVSAGIAGQQMDVYQDKFKWKHGICVADWRYVVRGCNIDVSNLIAESSAADVRKLMIKMVHRLPDRGKTCNPVFYCNRTVVEWLDIQRLNAADGSGLNYPVIDGVEMASFRGIPVRICDQLTLTEATIS